MMSIIPADDLNLARRFPDLALPYDRSFETSCMQYAHAPKI